MNRKLHNTVTALAATTGLLVLSLMASRPVAQVEAPVAAPVVAAVEVDASQAHLARIAGAAAEAATLAAIAAAFADADAAATQSIASPVPAPRKRAARGRQSVAMPYFSFAPRG